MLDNPNLKYVHELNIWRVSFEDRGKLEDREELDDREELEDRGEPKFAINLIRMMPNLQHVQ